MKALRVLVGCTAVLVGCTALAMTAAVMTGTDATAAEPSVTVSPSTGLAGGDTVDVTATGIPAGAPLRIVQCDLFVGLVDSDCPDLATASATLVGTVSVVVTVGDPVFRAEEFGDSIPVYCRADICRIFVVFDGDQGPQWVESDPLEFSGSPATIGASRTTDLPKKQQVKVTGTAFGAEGQTVQLLEQSCFSIIQGSGCYGQLPVVTTTVRGDGTWSTKYVVHRVLSDGTDCTGDILGACQLSAVVLRADETPDDSFGLSRLGQPHVFLTFRAR